MNIAEEVEYALLLQYTCEVYIKELQEKCEHPHATKVGRGSTGNYDPTQDCYWWEFKCPDCDKFWTKPQ